MLLTEIANKTSRRTTIAIDHAIEKPVQEALNGWFGKPDDDPNFPIELEHRVDNLIKRIEKVSLGYDHGDHGFINRQLQFLRDDYHASIVASRRGEDMWARDTKTFPRDTQRVEMFMRSFEYLVQESQRGNRPNLDEYLTSAHNKLSKFSPSL